MADEGEAVACVEPSKDQKRIDTASADATVLFDSKSVNSVTDCLAEAARAFIEVPEPVDLSPILKQALADGGICYSLTTATAHPLPLAQIVTDAIARIWPGVALPVDDLATVLNEAFANALLHGNLGVAAADARDPKALKAFYDAVTERLRDPSFANRRLGIAITLRDATLTIDVEDDGKGFDIEAARKKRDAGPDAFCGRGLAIMESFAENIIVHPPGNRISITFRLPPASSS
ncbi:MAG: ATP-binding protein [Magnetovibrionaceae bacterium]